ncbi:MAG: hypothetical protein EZS28_016169 [Streblomastix strix]|uniref:Uncharacterized protein n=1 Tax=Streblomastix strix TaxID=222440 RepID=A0A5J4W0A4_9EUKA|nr:MAG: hypothetical protein EZS28_016169 [Streblomastix strix]
MQNPTMAAREEKFLEKMQHMKKGKGSELNEIEQSISNQTEESDVLFCVGNCADNLDLYRDLLTQHLRQYLAASHIQRWFRRKFYGLNWRKNNENDIENSQEQINSINEDQFMIAKRVTRFNDYSYHLGHIIALQRSIRLFLDQRRFKKFRKNSSLLKRRQKNNGRKLAMNSVYGMRQLFENIDMRRIIIKICVDRMDTMRESFIGALGEKRNNISSYFEDPNANNTKEIQDQGQEILIEILKDLDFMCELTEHFVKYLVQSGQLAKKRDVNLGLNSFCEQFAHQCLETELMKIRRIQSINNNLIKQQESNNIFCIPMYSEEQDINKIFQFHSKF